MTRHYGHTVQVTAEHDLPRSVVWRGVSYRVLEILSAWHLRDHWWVGHGEAESAPASDRHYYRLTCAHELQCDIYHDVARDLWVLDRVYD